MVDVAQKAHAAFVDWLIPSAMLGIIIFVALPLTPLSIAAGALLVTILLFFRKWACGARRWLVFTLILIVLPVANYTYIRQGPEMRYFFQCSSVASCWSTHSRPVANRHVLIIPVFDFDIGYLPYDIPIKPRWSIASWVFTEGRNNRFVSLHESGQSGTWYHSPVERAMIEHARDPDDNVYAVIELPLRKFELYADYVPEGLSSESTVEIEAGLVNASVDVQTPFDPALPGVFSVPGSEATMDEWVRLVENDILAESMLGHQRDVRSWFYQKYLYSAEDPRAAILAAALLAADTSAWMKSTLDISSRRVLFRELTSLRRNFPDSDWMVSDALFRFWLKSMYVLYYGDYSEDSWTFYQVARIPDQQFSEDIKDFLSVLGDDLQRVNPVLFSLRMPVSQDRPTRLDWEIADFACVGAPADVEAWQRERVHRRMEDLITKVTRIDDRSMAVEIASAQLPQYKRRLSEFVLPDNVLRAERVRMVGEALSSIYVKPTIWRLISEVAKVAERDGISNGGKSVPKPTASTPLDFHGAYDAWHALLEAPALQELIEKTNILAGIVEERANWVMIYNFAREDDRPAIHAMIDATKILDNIVSDMRTIPAQQAIMERKQDIVEWSQKWISEKVPEVRDAIMWLVDQVTVMLMTEQKERQPWLLDSVIPELIQRAHLSAPWWSTHNEYALTVLRIHAAAARINEGLCRQELKDKWITELRDEEQMRKMLAAQQAAFVLFAACKDARAGAFAEAIRKTTGGADWVFGSIMVKSRKDDRMEKYMFMAEDWKDVKLPKCRRVPEGRDKKRATHTKSAQ